MQGPPDFQCDIQKAARAILDADALLIGAGAGMAVDAGLPDFRGEQGFWKAYPALHGRSFQSVANPETFRRDPCLAWGFYGHRLQLYRRTVAHSGYHVVRRWGEERPCGYFVFTSNVDGLFQASGIAPDRIVECHGSIHFNQCIKPCTQEIWPADSAGLEIDEPTCRAAGNLPKCDHCGEVSRPNVDMFDDDEWIDMRMRAQLTRFADWLERCRGKRVVAVEIGAGLAIPVVRETCERAATILIRVNPRDSAVGAGGISLPMTGLNAVLAIDRHMKDAREGSSTK